MSTASRRHEGPWTEAQVRALGVTTDLVTGGSVVGLSRGTTYRLNSEGALPFRVLRLGAQYRVPVADLLEVLGLPPNVREAGPASPATALHTPATTTSLRSP